MIVQYASIMAGIYLVGLSFLINGSNFRSDLIMRVIPGLIGVGNLIAGLKMAGYI